MNHKCLQISTNLHQKNYFNNLFFNKQVKSSYQDIRHIKKTHQIHQRALSSQLVPIIHLIKF
jgi:hypothetical protein